MKLVVDIKKKLGNFRLESAFETEDMITGFLGASGCGKTITLKCIAGIERPDEGHIELDGRVLFDSREHIDVRPQDRKVGYLFQNYALFPTMSVRGNIMCALHGVKDRRVREQKYDEVLQLLRLGGLGDHFPYQLSGGQAQRTALARMLVTEPELLLLDEPFSALDSFLRKSLQSELTDLLYKINRQAVVVTHSQKEVRKMCSKLFIMSNGRIIQSGAVEDVFSNPASDECRQLLEE